MSSSDGVPDLVKKIKRVFETYKMKKRTLKTIKNAKNYLHVIFRIFYTKPTSSKKIDQFQSEVKRIQRMKKYNFHITQIFKLLHQKSSA